MVEKHKALGRGLESLLPPRQHPFMPLIPGGGAATVGEAVLEIPLDHLDANPYQTRTQLDEKALDELCELRREFQPDAAWSRLVILELAPASTNHLIYAPQFLDFTFGTLPACGACIGADRQGARHALTEVSLTEVWYATGGSPVSKQELASVAVSTGQMKEVRGAPYGERTSREGSYSGSGRDGNPLNIRFASVLTNFTRSAGNEDGHDVEDWLRAEAELKSRKPRSAAA